MNLVRNGLGALLRLIKNLLLANPKLRVLLYDLYNRDEFGNLYEHEKMLADAVRVDTYKKGIQKHVGQGDLVLDLGTGSGILAFFAAQQRPEKVYAVDHSEFIHVAQKIAERNGFGNIEFVRSNSRNFDPEIRFDVIIHEQIGDYLFNENMLQNLLDLKRRLLKPGGRILPGIFELYLEPVCLTASFKTPYLWENQLYGVDFSFLKEEQEALAPFKPAAYRQEWFDARAVDHFLCVPEPILRFDLNTLNSADEIPRSIAISRRVTSPGPLDSFCLYFKAAFDAELGFDTSPFSTRTHWGNCYFRMDGRNCGAGEIITGRLNMPDLLNITTWTVSLPSPETESRTG